MRNIKRLALKLNCSLRTAYNYVAKYKKNSKEAFSHGNHAHKPSTTKDDALRNQILEIYNKISKDTHVNFRHFCVISKRDFDIFVSYTFIYQLLSSIGAYSPKCKRTTRSKRNQKIRQKMQENKKLTAEEEAIVTDHLLDDCTGKILGAYFDKQETLNGYYN